MDIGIYNIKLREGMPYTLRFNLKDKQGNPTDLTGYKAHLMVKVFKNDENPLVYITSDGGDIVLGGMTHSVVAKIPHTLLEKLPDYPKAGVWDFVLVQPGGEPMPILGGKAEFIHMATKVAP
jgi:hypothetical protein